MSPFFFDVFLNLKFQRMPTPKAAPRSARKSTGKTSLSARGKSPAARKSLSVFDPEVDALERESWVCAHACFHAHCGTTRSGSTLPTRLRPCVAHTHQWGMGLQLRCVSFVHACPSDRTEFSSSVRLARCLSISREILSECPSRIWMQTGTETSPCGKGLVRISMQGG